eukprot:gene30114-37276_t
MDNSEQQRRPGRFNVRLAGSTSITAMALAVSAAYAPAYAQSTQPVPAAQETATVVVTGMRAALESALNKKREDNGIVDVIKAEDMGKFPDTNLAESLQRVPGVVIDRDAGEGRSITVRGLGQDFTRVRINGIEGLATTGGTDSSGGANMGYRTGDDVYAFGSGQAPVCVWDAGGNNTFDFSACIGATQIDLRAGAFSGTASGLANVSIAYNVSIRNVLTGAGGSSVTLNDAGNVMKGGSGADLVRVGAGDDTINTGDGEDTVVFSGLFASYSIMRTAEEVRIAGQGLDVLSGVELLQFADMRVNVADLALRGPSGGTSGNDMLQAAPGNEFVDGGAGLDTLVYGGARGSYTVRASGKGYTVTDGGGSVDVLTGVERVKFSDGAVALDVGVDGAAGEVFRLFRAALDRAPASGGLGFWMSALDHGTDLGALAQSFLDSAEFNARYGGYDNKQFLTQLYLNALHRAPDEAGLNWNVAILDAGMSRATMLLNFADSPECQAAVAGLVGNGLAYTPFG